jgi:hypothetical protein
MIVQTSNDTYEPINQKEANISNEVDQIIEEERNTPTKQITKEEMESKAVNEY